MNDTSWMSSAVCTSVDPEYFFPETPRVHGRRQMEAAAAICRSCPVIFQCQQYAKDVNATHGVWGGQARPGKALPVGYEIRHGTEAGAKAHYRRDEVPCGSCLRAANFAKSMREEARRKRA